MTVRDSSRLANQATESQQAVERARILALLVRHGWMTRRQVADKLGMETSSVAARVNLLIARGAVIEDAELKPCPLTGIRVHWINAAPTPDQVAA